MKVMLQTFGCQMNRLDSELAIEALNDAGYQITEDESEAEVVLYNTCSVRDHAEERVVQRIRQLPKTKIIGIMGCLAQRMGDDLFKLLPKHLDIICGTKRFPYIAYLLDRVRSGEKRVIDTAETPLSAPGTLAAHERGLHKGMQGFVSVMRGCNNFCTYCIVPYVRGRETSRPIEAVVEEVRSLTEKGAVEVTLLGQNIDAYGKDIDTTLSVLLRAVHNNVPAAKRIRYVTSHPRDITTELLQTIAELPRVCKHLHMPAQSGSTRVLESMKRGYTREIYDEKLAAIKEIIPEALVTSDFIVGFPGETDEDFKLTEELVASANFQTSYVFKYSPRPGTFSEKNMVDDVPEAAKKARNQSLLAIQDRVSLERNKSLIGSEVEVLVEGISRRDKSRLTGRTSNNLITVFTAPENAEKLTAQLVRVRINDATALTLYGELVNA